MKQQPTPELSKANTSALGKRKREQAVPSASKKQRPETAPQSSPNLSMQAPRPQANANKTAEQNRQYQARQQQTLSPQLSEQQIAKNNHTIVMGLETLFEKQLKNRPGSTHQWRKSIDIFMQRTASDVRNGGNALSRDVRLAFATNFRCHPNMMNQAFQQAMVLTARRVLLKHKQLENTRNLRNNQNVQMHAEGVRNSLMLNPDLNPLYVLLLGTLLEALAEAQRDIEDAQKAIEDKRAYDRQEDEEKQENLEHELQMEPQPSSANTQENNNYNELKIAEPQPGVDNERIFKELLDDQAQNQGQESNRILGELCKEAAVEEAAHYGLSALKTSLSAAAGAA